MKTIKRIIEITSNVLLLTASLVGAVEIGTWVAYILHEPSVSTVTLMMV